MVTHYAKQNAARYAARLVRTYYVQLGRARPTPARWRGHTRLLSSSSLAPHHLLSSPQRSARHQSHTHGGIPWWQLFLGSSAFLGYAHSRGVAQADASALNDGAPMRDYYTWSELVSLFSEEKASGPYAHLAEDEDETRFTIEFAPARHADLHLVLVTLLAAFDMTECTIRAEDAPTSTLLRAEGSSAELEISAPRFGPFASRVSLELVRDSPRALFPAREVDAVIRAVRISQGSNSVRAEFAAAREEDDSGFFGGLTVDDDPTAPVQRRGKGGSCSRRGAQRGMDGVHQKAKEAREKLEELGIEVVDGDSSLDWGALAGYDDVKRRIDDTLTLPLRHPTIYEGVVRGTRERFESNLPKAVLYEGPPGCGKTLSARILAATVGIPFVHIPLESLLSKFYGETTRRLATALKTANDLGPCLVFIDECDSIGLSRNSSTEIHEVTRRTLSVLLRHIDGLDGPQNSILLAATNHMDDIDPALMSRFDVVISFPLPDTSTRAKVLALYAKHLSDEERAKVAQLSEGFSGRELLDACEEAERTHAGRLVRAVKDGKGSLAETGDGNGQRRAGTRDVRKTDAMGEDGATGKALPDLQDYVAAIAAKAPSAVGRQHSERARAHMALSGRAPPVTV